MPNDRPSERPELPLPHTPWWRIGMVWLVIGGPLAVVVASLVTAAIASAGADDVLSDADKRGAGADAQARVPAIQARNHAATPKP